MPNNQLKSGALLALFLFSGQLFASHFINGLEGIKNLRGNAKGPYYVQLGSFANKSNAYRLLHQQEKQWGKRVSIRTHGKYYIVNIGPLQTAAEVRSLVNLPVNQESKVAKQHAAAMPETLKTETVLTTYSISKEPMVYSRLPLTVGASGGYGQIKNAYRKDGNTGIGRFNLGLQLYQFRALAVGVEAGIQSGNTMRMATNPQLLELIGGLQPQASVKPIIDALATLRGNFGPTLPFDYRLKGGIAYRQLQFENRTSSKDTLSKVNGEFQAGLGYNLTPNLALTAMYQGIYSSNNAKMRQDVLGDLIITRIPTQQAGLLGVEYSFR